MGGARQPRGQQRFCRLRPLGVLTNRALSRATLARQLLLQRSARPPIDAIEHLVGLQAQNPLDPYLALWSRLDDFDPDEVGRLLEARELVRIVVMRGTIHLVTADDARSCVRSHNRFSRRSWPGIRSSLPCSSTSISRR